ncbi:HD domain-containing phosphohydrolase [Hippea alviniae]|uniref:HD domain-containing phosphohydrolase n=1 Tax=Hippea alviniae TaxID=1279027 RepID=UPI0003B54FD3|nr:HD domain-containing phosphohydrolase [Hippea alviniae]
MKEKLFLEIIEDLHSGEFEKNGWQYILNKIKKLFNINAAFFASYEDESLLICHSSEEDLDGNKVESDTVAAKTILEKSTFVVRNYATCQFASQKWIEKGMKSLLSVPVYFKDKVFGALQVASFSDIKKFTPNQVSLLETIARVISFVLYHKSKIDTSDKILSLMIKEFEFFYSQNLPDFFNREKLKSWVVAYLKNILHITDAKAVGFIFPNENIYVAIHKENNELRVRFSFEITDEIKDYILYQIYEKSIGDIVSFDELNKYGLKPSSVSKQINIKSGLFVPVKFNDRVIVAVGFGFDRKINIDRDYKLALQNSAAHLTFMLIASKNVSILNNELVDTQTSFLESFILMMEARDTYTKGHSQRVAFYAKSIAKALGYNQIEQEKIYTAGLLHDIGKIGIPDNILLKPGKLTPNEYKIIKNHAEFSYQIIKNIKQFKDISDCVRYHHERCNGSGYPKGLTCQEIPECARILAIADVFDAITTNRPYRRSLALERALEVIQKHMSDELDQKIVEKSIDSLREAYEYLKSASKEKSFVPEEIDKIREQIFTTDYMTGLLRRKQFVRAVSDYIKESRRFVMFYFDIKNLSYINYGYSMEIGDKIIIHTAEALKKREEIRFLARTEPDAFYFVVVGVSEPALYSAELKKYVKDYVIDKLSKEEFFMKGWSRIISYYVSFSEFVPGKSAEDMMYECKQRKKEFEELLM